MYAFAHPLLLVHRQQGSIVVLAIKKRHQKTMLLQRAWDDSIDVPGSHQRLERMPSRRRLA
jgi:hypothetical protein